MNGGKVDYYLNISYGVGDFSNVVHWNWIQFIHGCDWSIETSIYDINEWNWS